MTIIQLQYFHEVCRCKSFAKAAEELHVSQPAVSAAIRNFEHECGVLLFYRDKNALRLTNEGNILLEESVRILDQYDHLNTLVQNLSFSKKSVRIGLSTLSGMQVYPEIIREYKKRYPDVEVTPFEASTGELFEKLDQGLLDVIITIKRRSDQLTSQEFDQIYGHWPTKNHLEVFCVSTQNPLAKEARVTLEQIVKEPLILLKDNFYQTKKLKKLLEEAGLTYQVIHYTNQAYTVERFVESNIAAGFLPMAVVAMNSRIAGLPYEGTETKKIEIFWRKDRYMFFTVKALIGLVKEMYPRSTYFE